MLEKSRQLKELQGEMSKVEGSTHKLEQEKSKLNKKIEEEQISNSWDRENLEEAGKGKTETRFGIETTEARGKNRQSGKRKPRRDDKNRTEISGRPKGIR